MSSDLWLTTGHSEFYTVDPQDQHCSLEFSAFRKMFLSVPCYMVAAIEHLSMTKELNFKLQLIFFNLSLNTHTFTPRTAQPFLYLLQSQVHSRWYLVSLGWFAHVRPAPSHGFMEDLTIHIYRPLGISPCTDSSYFNCLELWFLPLQLSLHCLLKFSSPGRSPHAPSFQVLKSCTVYFTLSENDLPHISCPVS